MDYVLYFHRKKLDRSIFYVGIGNYGRAFDYGHRGFHWKNIARKYGVDTEIVEYFDCFDKAKAKEVEYIETFGRIGYEEGGILCNKTLGGEGSKGLKPWNAGKKNVYTDETITRIRETKIKLGQRPTNKAIEKARELNTGRKVAHSTKAKLSIQKINGLNPVARKVIDVNTGEVLDSVVEACQKTVFKYNYFLNMLLNRYPNYTTFLFLDDYINAYSTGYVVSNKNHILYKPIKSRQSSINKIIGKTKMHLVKVINTETGEIFGSIKDAVQSCHYSVGHMSSMLRGTKSNKTPFKLLYS